METNHYFKYGVELILEREDAFKLLDLLRRTGANPLSSRRREIIADQLEEAILKTPRKYELIRAQNARNSNK